MNLDVVHDLAPTIAGRATEIETARRLPPDLVKTLIKAGCFRTLLPRSHGGDGMELPAAMRVLETLSQADGSVGWTVMIGAGAWCDLAGLSRETFDAIYADGPDVITGGAISPSGSATPVDGGYRIRGTWAFVSGCQHCDWLFGNCVEDVDGEPRFRLALFRSTEVEIEDTWSVSGLCGTGSHHVVADVVIPAERTYLLLDGEPCLDEPVVRIPPPALYSLQIATVAVGIAQGALDDIQAMAADKTPLLSPTTLAANPLFQYQLATADTRLRAARALLYQDADATWASATASLPFTLEQRARIRSTAAWVAGMAASVVTSCYRAGGGSAIYLDNPLQRRLRDISALTQHFLVKPDTLTTAGAILTGQESDPGLF